MRKLVKFLLDRVKNITKRSDNKLKAYKNKWEKYGRLWKIIESRWIFGHYDQLSSCMSEQSLEISRILFFNLVLVHKLIYIRVQRP